MLVGKPLLLSLASPLSLPADEPSTHHSVVTWRELSCPDSGKRKFHTSTLFKDYIITYGGDSGSGELDDILLFDCKQNTWKYIESVEGTPNPRQGHSACLYQDNTIIIFGGINRTGVLNQTSKIVISEKDEITIDFQNVETEGNEDIFRYSHSAVIYQDALWVFAGADKQRKSTNDLWRLDLVSNKWEKCSKTIGDVPHKRHFHSAFLHNGKMYIFGGYSTFTEAYSNEVFSFDFNTLEWELLAPLGGIISPRSGTSVSQQGDLVYFFGGYTIKGHSSDLFSYNIRENYFEEISFQSVNPMQKAYHQSVLYRNGLIIWGGKSKKDISSSIFRIDLGEKEIEQDEIGKDLNRPKQSKYINQMKGMLYNKTLSDVCFEVQGQEFPCHRIVLAARCKYFENMFTSDMMEAHQAKISISDISAPTFKALIEFIYCDEVKLSEELALDLLSLSDKYSLYDLKHICEEVLAKNLSLENFVSRAKVSELYEASFLRQAIVEYGIKYMKDLQERKELQDLPMEFFIEIIMKLQGKVGKLEEKVKALNKKFYEK